MSSQRQHLTREDAEGIAAQGLAFLAGDPARIARFLALTGLTPDQIRKQVDAPQFLAGILEHLASDESLLLMFAANSSVAPETIVSALAELQRASSTGARP